MARQLDRSKERFWRAMLRQWRHSGLTIRAFCAEHRLTEPSFYAWRRILTERDQHAAPAAQPGTQQTINLPPFVPVHLLPAPASAPLELILDHGRVVRVPAGFDPASLRLLLAVLEEEHSC